MRLRTVLIALAGLLASGVVVVVAPTLAHAEQMQSTYCERIDSAYPDGFNFRVDAEFYYFETPSTSTRTWTKFRYKLHGYPNRTSNNVNISVSQNGNFRYGLDSPDNRVSDVWYEVIPSSPVHSSTRVVNIIEFDAIFDVPVLVGGDPHCPAWWRFFP